MASIEDAYAGIVAEIVDATTGLSIPSGLIAPPGALTVLVGSDYPPLDVLQSIGGSRNVAVSVFDRGEATDTTQYITPPLISEVSPDPQISSTVSNTSLITTSTVTVGLVSPHPAPGVDDAISIELFNNTGQLAQTYSAIAGDTPTTIAAALAANINADPDMSQWVHATTAGPIITLTNLLPNTLIVGSWVGNITTRIIQEREVCHRIQIILYAGNTDARKIVGDAIVSRLGKLSNRFGIQMPDQSWCRIQNVGGGGVPDDRESLQDTYIKHFFVKATFAITSVEQAWSVLAVVIDQGNIEPDQ